MSPRNKTAKLALVRLLHRSKVEFSISLASNGCVTVNFTGVDGPALVFGSLDPSWSGSDVVYFLDWPEFSAAVAAKIAEIKAGEVKA